MYKYINKEDEQCKPLLSTFDGANNNNSINYSTVDNDYNAQHLNSDKIKPASKASSTNSEGTTVDYETKYKLPVLLTQSGWKTLFQHCSTTVYLENKGAVARDHLANERTYLAWLRTSLSTISVGIGITQLFRLEKSMTQKPTGPTPILGGQVIGTSFVLIGMVFLLFAFIRYFHVQTTLTKGYFPASRTTVSFASLLLFLAMVVMLASVTIQR